jgi:hypothetical protein
MNCWLITIIAMVQKTFYGKGLFDLQIDFWWTFKLSEDVKPFWHMGQWINSMPAWLFIYLPRLIWYVFLCLNLQWLYSCSLVNVCFRMQLDSQSNTGHFNPTGMRLSRTDLFFDMLPGMKVIWRCILAVMYAEPRCQHFPLSRNMDAGGME